MSPTGGTGVRTDSIRVHPCSSVVPYFFGARGNGLPRMTRVSKPDNLAADIAARTDSYFNRTRKIVARFGDRRVTYAVFMRRPVIAAPRLMTEWLDAVAAARGTKFDIELMYAEGEWVGAGEPLAYIAGSL